MRDYKYEMQLRAEEMAEEKFGKDFSELTPDDQDKLIQEAGVSWSEDQIERAEMLRDR